MTSKHYKITLCITKYKHFLTLCQLFEIVQRAIWLCRRSLFNAVPTQLDTQPRLTILEYKQTAWKAHAKCLLIYSRYKAEFALTKSDEMNFWFRGCKPQIFCRRLYFIFTFSVTTCGICSYKTCYNLVFWGVGGGGGE
jgi:hypothetical protein